MRARLDNSRRLAFSIITVLLLSTTLPLAANAATGKTTTVWSGTVILQDGYTVGAQDVLVVQAGTTIRLGADEDITVDGRITIQGNQTSPVVLESCNHLPAR